MIGLDVRTIAALVAVAMATACAPVDTTVRWPEHPLGTRDVERSRRRELIASATSEAEHVRASVSSRSICTTERVDRVQRERVEKRSVDRLALGLLYGGGVIFGTAGGLLLTDTTPLGMPEELVQPVGIGSAALGGVLLVSAVVSSFRGGEKREPAEPIERPIAGSRREAPCGIEPAPGIPVELVLRGPGGADVVVPMGATDLEGGASVAWTSIPREVVSGDAWVRSAAMYLHEGTERRHVADVDLSPARQRAAEAAWTETKALGTPEAYSAFARDFAEVRSGERSASVRQALEARLHAALAARDVTGARAAKEQLAREGSVPPALAEQVQRLEDEHSLAATWTAFQAHREAVAEKVARDAADAPSILALAEEHAALRVRDPAHPQHAAIAREVDLLRATQKARLVKQARAAEKASSWDEALALVASARTLAPTDRALEKQAAALERKKVQFAQREARRAEAELAAEAKRAAAAAKREATAAAREARRAELAAAAEAKRTAAEAKRAEARASAEMRRAEAVASAEAAAAARKQAEDAAAARLAAERERPHELAITLPASWDRRDVLDALGLSIGCTGTFRSDAAGTHATMTCGDTRFELSREARELRLSCLGQPCSECGRRLRALTSRIDGKKPAKDTCGP